MSKGSIPVIARLGQDLRHTWRSLRAAAGSVGLAVALLALAIGMSSAMFTVVDALILRPAPFCDPATFVWLGVGESDVRFNVNLPLGIIKALRASPIAALKCGRGSRRGSVPLL